MSISSLDPSTTPPYEHLAERSSAQDVTNVLRTGGVR